MKYRYTITFDADDEEFWEDHYDEDLRKDLESAVMNFYPSNLKVLMEDEECIRRNDKPKNKSTCHGI